MRNFVRQFAIKGWQFLHAFILVAGMSIILLLLLESCFRVERAVSERRRGFKPGAPLPGDPQAKQPWFDEFLREYDETRPQRWKSYVYFGRLPSYKGKYVNIDSAGHRVTPQPTGPGAPAARVFFFGGSTMWGTDQRDDHTIPAEAARRLQPLAGPGGRVEVTNFGESGYVTTQELIALLLELRAGNIPDVVVFYDGINDVGTTVQYGAPGIPQNESKRAAEFAMGRAIDRNSFERGTRKDLKALRVLAGSALDQMALVEWAQSKKPRPVLTYIPADSAARGTVHVYTGVARIVEGLGKAYGFEPIFVWQPSVHATPKTLTPYEDRIVKQIRADDFQRRIGETQLAIPALLDTAMARIAPGRFVDASGLFAGDTLPVFVDRIGHNTEVSVPRIVDTFWPALEAATKRAVANRTAGGPR